MLANVAVLGPSLQHTGLKNLETLQGSPVISVVVNFGNAKTKVREDGRVRENLPKDVPPAEWCGGRFNPSKELDIFCFASGIVLHRIFQILQRVRIVDRETEIGNHPRRQCDLEGGGKIMRRGRHE